MNENPEVKSNLSGPTPDAWREVAVVALLLAASLGSLAMGDTNLASSLGGAAVCLIVPTRSVGARVAVIAGAVVLASALSGCGGATPVSVTRSACAVARPVCSAVNLACGLVPSEGE